MKNNTQIQELKRIIEQTLTPEITNDYIYLDLPYYTNIGDTLIWEGTCEYLAKLPYKCLYASDMNFFVERTLDTDVIILLQGGGNFGDKYREHTAFRKKIISLYPQNRIIILPQTVYYDNKKNLSDDINFYSKYENVLICARDEVSYRFIQDNFTNRVLLVPDLAFYININKFHIPTSRLSKTLFLKRQDAEYVLNEKYDSVPLDADVCDWPTYYRTSTKLAFVDFIFRVLKLVALIGRDGRKRKNYLEDFKRNCFYRSEYTQIGISFLSQYDTIYTTRLHVLILGVLLGKNIFVYNNSTGKLNNFYCSWLSGFHNIKLISSNQ